MGPLPPRRPSPGAANAQAQGRDLGLEVAERDRQDPAGLALEDPEGPRELGERRVGADLDREREARGVGEGPPRVVRGPRGELQGEARRLCLRTRAKGTCGAVFQAVGVALPPTVRQLETTA